MGSTDRKRNKNSGGELIVKRKKKATSFFPMSIVQPPRVEHVLIFLLSLWSSCDRSSLSRMALRRLAQENHASGSPQTPSRTLMNGPLPTTPRPRPSYPIHRSPADTPSISSSVPFDWEAARSRAPPPYASPLRTRPRKSVGADTPRKGIVRKKSVFER